MEGRSMDRFNKQRLIVWLSMIMALWCYGCGGGTSADTAEFEKSGQGANTRPVAVIDSITPNPAPQGAEVQFTGHGTDSDGSVVYYRWESSLSGFLSDSAFFTISTLQVGEHVITLTCTDNDDAVSNPVSTTLVIQGDGEPVPVISDNGGAGTSFTGVWSVSGADDSWGPNSLWARNGATYTWRFTPTVSGHYLVSMWWTEWPSRATNAPVDIVHSGGTSRVLVNQQVNGGQWNGLGTYEFQAGQEYTVTITAVDGDTVSTCADAVRLTSSGGPGQNPPHAVIDSIAPNPAQQGEAVTFQGHGTDDGTIQSYVWESNLDGVFGSSATVTSAILRPGTHTISFKVQDDDGLWSAPATQSLTIHSATAQTIIDNGQAGTSFTGTWYVSGGANPYGENSLTTMESGATYTFQASLDGTHDVALWWTHWSSRCTAVPVDIYNGTTLLETVYVNQQQNAGQWNAIGTYGFSGTARVRLRAQAGCSTCADAVKFAGSDEQVNVRPVASIDSITPNPAPQGAEVQFTGHGTDSDGTVVFYRWESSLTGFLSNAASFSISTLPVGEHVISLTCTDNDGAVSNPVSTTLVIQGDGEPVPVVSDNGGDGTSSTGNWSVSGASDPWGANSLWARNGATYTWRFTPQVSGNYIVSMWWTEWPSRATNAPVDIIHSGGTSRVLVNQQVNGGRWNELGIYGFTAGQEYTVTITAVDGDTVSTCADAVRFEYTTSQPPPPTEEHIYAALVYNWENSQPALINTLESVGAVNEGTRWRYVRAGKTYYIYIVRDLASFEQALRTPGAHVLIAGHSNYGIGQLFATNRETRDQRIDNLYYLDDDRFSITSTPWMHVSISGMRTGQAYPFWWPTFKDGTSGIMPYDFDDPGGDPPYNYYLSYRLPGGSTWYRIETARNGAIERFPDSGVAPWFSSTGASPDPANPNHLKYFITNSNSWIPSFETTGIWTASLTGTDYFKENYLYTPAGTGSRSVDWLFGLPLSGRYNLFAWWPTADTNTGGARYTIEHADGQTTRVMNQKTGGGQWNSLGQYSFDTSTYRVRLTNQASSGNIIADAIRITHVDNPPAVIQADFNAIVRSGPAPLTVEFDSESTGDITGIAWDFGDGFTNTTRDFIEHTYTSPGVYTVRLTVTGPEGSSTRTKNGYIVVGNTPETLRAEFSGNRQEGTVPLNSSFRNLSSQDAISWEWDFGDGSISTESSPSHTYTVPGNYTVTLRVTDGQGNVSTETKQNFVLAKLYDRSIDNVDYPKTHYRSKTILFRKELDVPKEELRYSRLFFDTCNAGNYYLGTFDRGIVFYTLNLSDGRAINLYLKAYLEGKTDEELWEIVQTYESVWDYYDFSKTPAQQ
jgi:PKD repeat protein